MGRWTLFWACIRSHLGLAFARYPFNNGGIPPATLLGYMRLNFTANLPQVSEFEVYTR